MLSHIKHMYLIWVILFEMGLLFELSTFSYECGPQVFWFHHHKREPSTTRGQQTEETKPDGQD